MKLSQIRLKKNFKLYGSEGIFLNKVFSSNRALIGPNYKPIKYSSNESTVLLKNPGF